MNPCDPWFDGIARNLITRMAHKAPPALAARLEEEWLADLSARSGVLPQLRFALGCCWATTVIAREFTAPVRAAAAGPANRTTVVDAAGLRQSFSRRTTVILLIVGLHVLVIGVLATTIVAPKVFKGPPPRIVADFVPSPRPLVPPPTPVDLRLKSFDIDPPLPPAPVVPTEDTATTRDQIREQPSAYPAGAPVPRPVNRVLGGPGAGFPDADDFYPQASIRGREMGVATVSVCVDSAGRLIGRPILDQSSGSSRLDEAALRLARAGSGHYRATTENGRPVSACYPFRVRFQLRD
jgi:TonB family protein